MKTWQLKMATTIESRQSCHQPFDSIITFLKAEHNY